MIIIIINKVKWALLILVYDYQINEYILQDPNDIL